MVIDDNQQKDYIPAEDVSAVYSLLLYFSCVFRISQFFQKCCECLDAKNQPIVLQFFATINKMQENKEHITKEVVRQAICEAAPAKAMAHMKFICSSPMKTPDKIAPTPTPSKLISHEKLMELKRTKTQLENERYERNLLEAEMKDYEEKIELLRKLSLTIVR